LCLTPALAIKQPHIQNKRLVGATVEELLHNSIVDDVLHKLPSPYPSPFLQRSFGFSLNLELSQNSVQLHTFLCSLHNLPQNFQWPFLVYMYIWIICVSYNLTAIQNLTFSWSACLFIKSLRSVYPMSTCASLLKKITWQSGGILNDPGVAKYNLHEINTILVWNVSNSMDKFYVLIIVLAIPIIQLV